MCPLRSLETYAARSCFIVNLSFYIRNILLLLCVCLSVFGKIIAIDADSSTDFKFNPTRACCFNSHNDMPQVAQRNASIVAHTQHRSPYLSQPDCCCFVPFLITTSPPPASQRNVSMVAERAWCIRPSPMRLLSCDTICDLQYFIRPLTTSMRTVLMNLYANS